MAYLTQYNYMNDNFIVYIKHFDLQSTPCKPSRIYRPAVVAIEFNGRALYHG